MDSTSKMKITLDIIYNHQTFSHSIESGSDFTLLEHLNQLQVPIDQSCGGNGTCGTCKVRIVENLHHLNPRSDIEIEMQQDRQFLDDERLCCQTHVLGSVKIRIPD